MKVMFIKTDRSLLNFLSLTRIFETVIWFHTTSIFFRYATRLVVNCVIYATSDDGTISDIINFVKFKICLRVVTNFNFQTILGNWNQIALNRTEKLNFKTCHKLVFGGPMRTSSEAFAEIQAQLAKTARKTKTFIWISLLHVGEIIFELSKAFERLFSKYQVLNNAIHNKFSQDLSQFSVFKQKCWRKQSLRYIYWQTFNLLNILKTHFDKTVKHFKLPGNSWKLSLLKVRKKL